MEVYADYAATTPVKPEVIDAMMEIYQSHFGNPSSIHSIGIFFQAEDGIRDNVG